MQKLRDQILPLATKTMKKQATPEPLAPIVTEIGKKVEAKCLAISTKFKEEKEHFLEQFKACPPHALEWCTETILQRQEEEYLWMRATAIVRKAATEEDAQKAMLAVTAEIAQRVIRFPPRHNSTSLVANLSTQTKNAAACDFVESLTMITGDFTYAT
jgi:hypothetical protein